MVITGIWAGYLLHLQGDQWRLLLIGLGATVGFMVVGFIDDWHKVHSNEGLSERAKLAACSLSQWRQLSSTSGSSQPAESLILPILILWVRYSRLCHSPG